MLTTRLKIPRINIIGLLFLTPLLGACVVPEVADVRQAAAETAETQPARPQIGLTEEILYKLLVAEFAGHRNRLDIAIENYLDLATSTRDIEIVKRATQIAVFARDDAAAAEAASLWIELDPNHPDPRQVLGIMSIRAGDVEQALQHLEVIIRTVDGELDQKLWMIVNFLSREQDQAVIMDVMERLMRNYMDNTHALFAYARIAARLGETERSKQLLERLLELEPDNDNVAMSYITLLQRQDRSAEAIDWIESVLDDKQNDFALRHAYARLLTDTRRFDEARRQFEILSVQAPNNTEILYALGLLYLQVNRFEQAETYFLRLAEMKSRISKEANYYLGRLAEEKNDLEQATYWYQGVHGGENYFDARVRLSLVLAKQGQVDTALEKVRNVQARNFEDTLTLIQAEAEVLTKAERYDEALKVFNAAISKKVHPDLLYARAMLAERMDQLDVVERDLNAILREQPDNAQALNALGYTLADKTDRYDEAYDLIKKALELSPDDFYILDSMGWVLYRLGRLPEAVIHLRKALELRNDPEIAAHLGEVLWVMGEKQTAKQIWETALQDTPEDHRLLEVIQRFNP